MHRYLEARMDWWKDWWQDGLVVAMEGWLEMCWMGKMAGRVLGERKGSAWQCGLGVCRSDKDQDMVWEEVLGHVERGNLRW